MTYNNLDTELAEAGAPTDYKHIGKVLTPLSALVNGSFSSKAYMGILLKYLPQVDNDMKEFIARALTEKGNKKASKPLLELFEDSSLSQGNLWAIGNALYVIDDKKTYTEIINLCRNKKLGSSRQMMLGTLARSKSHEAYQVLIDCLKDDSVKGHAIEALGRMGDPKAIEAIENTEVRKGKYEFKAKLTALRKLEKKATNNR